MEHNYIFRGSRTQYYRVLYAEWKRLSASLGKPPFEFEIPSLQNSPSFAEFVPQEGEDLWITFYGEQNCSAVSVSASSEPGAKILFLTTFIQPEALEPRGEPSYAAWKNLKASLMKEGWLIDPAARYYPKKPRGMQGRIRDAIEQLQKTRSEAIRDHRPIPTKAFVMHEVKISPKTWRRHDPKLWAHWYETAYNE